MNYLIPIGIGLGALAWFGMKKSPTKTSGGVEVQPFVDWLRDRLSTELDKPVSVLTTTATPGQHATSGSVYVNPQTQQVMTVSRGVLVVNVNGTEKLRHYVKEGTLP